MATSPEGVASSGDSGIEDELLRLWTQHEGKLRALVTKLTGSRDTAEDVLQETFTKVYGRVRQLRPGNLIAYCFRAAYNTAHDYIRRQSKLYPCGLLELPSHEDPHKIYEQQERNEQYRHVIAAIPRLPAKNRHALQILLNEERLTHASQRLGIPPSTLRSGQSAGIKKLRNYVYGFP